MKPLSRDEIVPLEPYGRIREAYRAAVIDYKRRRRMPVGPNVTLLFEDRETLRFQVQEMLWVERIADARGIQQELDVYNELLPGPRELSATLFVEITEAEHIRPELDRLIGIDEHVALVLPSVAGRAEVPARFDPKQLEEDRISAVQYIRFALDEAQGAALADPRTPAAIRIAHPAYHYETPIPGEVRESLAAGLAADPPSLLPEIPDGGAAAASSVFEGRRVRAYRPEPARHPGHVIVEPREPGTHWSDLDGVLAEELSAVLRHVVAQVMQRFGACRIQADAEAGAPVRWHVVPRSEQSPAEDA